MIANHAELQYLTRSHEVLAEGWWLLWWTEALWLLEEAPELCRRLFFIGLIAGHRSEPQWFLDRSSVLTEIHSYSFLFGEALKYSAMQNVFI
jgi:hypothetical protein